MSQHLIDLFDSLHALGEDHVMLESRHPGCARVLREWAAARFLRCERVDINGADPVHDGCWSAKIRGDRSIDVWTVRAEKVAA